MFNLVDLTGKKIVLTGASQGIGRDTAIMLSKLGAQMILIARCEEKLKETISCLEGVGHSYYLLDITQLDDIENCVRKIVEDNGAVDGLVYCAGVGTSRPLNFFKHEIIQDVLQVNLLGFIEFVRCFAKRKRYNRGMRIVGISSIAALRGDKTHTAYSASKAGMDGAVRCLAKELADKNICINTVAPAMIKTAMYEGYLANNGEESNIELLKRQYLGLGETKDVAAAIAFLMSQAAKFITGICMPVDGGYTSC